MVGIDCEYCGYHYVIKTHHNLIDDSHVINGITSFDPMHHDLVSGGQELIEIYKNSPNLDFSISSLEKDMIYRYSDDDKRSDAKKLERRNEEKEKFVKWLDDNGFSYLFINRDLNLYPTLFKGVIKKPDFLLLIENIGMVAIDVKIYSSEDSTLSLSYDRDLKKGITFRRVFNMPMWFVFRFDDYTWFWINSLKTFEMGRDVVDENGELTVVIDKEEFTVIKDGTDISKLWEDEMPSYKKNYRGRVLGGYGNL
jgi:hypothetical protein